MNKIKIGIIEDQPHIRIPLTELFNAEQETTCVISVESIESYLYQINLSDQPDVLLCDIELPGTNGIEGIKEIKRIYPSLSISMLTVYQDSDKIFSALCAGANGYLLKNEPFSEIKKAVIDIWNGGSYMSPPIARKVLDYFSPKTQLDNKLTPREKEVVEWISEGLSNKIIADKLSVSLHTIKFHLRNIYGKLHINSKNELLLKTFKKEF